MEHEQYFFKSSLNQDISARVWKPDNEIKAVMIICHGMAEHIKRYDGFAEFLAKNQILSCGIDYPGHGDSVNGCLGFFTEKDGAQYVTNCILKLKQDITVKYPGVPLILFGHSLGSFFARYIASNYSEGIDCFIFCGTQGPLSIIKLAKLLAKIGVKLKGAKHPNVFIDNLMNNMHNKAFKPLRTNFDWLNRDEVSVDRYLADEKCGFVFTSSAFYDMFYVLDYINAKKWYSMLDKNKPYLLISGSACAVGEFGKGVNIVYNSMKEADITDVTLKLYENARHEILNELNYKEVYEDIINYINKKINTGK
ncbi:MAG: alpha/beta hydrolase [Eubacteriaceae bacterium]|nr:alpha/beta hydrolase [Eubacteriaceae bacterium]